MIKPKINVALRSFFRAIAFFCFSASCSGVSLGTTIAGLLLGIVVVPPPSELPTVEFGPTDTCC